MEAFIKFCLICIISILLTLLQGYVASILYVWLILPVFTGPAINWLSFAGILSFINFILIKTPPKEEINFIEMILFHISACIIALLFGYAIHYIAYVI